MLCVLHFRVVSFIDIAFLGGFSTSGLPFMSARLGSGVETVVSFSIFEG